MRTNFLLESVKGRDYIEEQNVDGKTIT